MALLRGRLLAGALFAGILFGPQPSEAIQLGSGQRKATEEELWRQLPEPQVVTPKVEKVEIEVVEKVFLPSSEVTPDEVASIAMEVAKKFKKSTVVVEDDDDEEAILLLLGVL